MSENRILSVDFGGLSTIQLAIAASWVHSMDPSYYDLFLEASAAVSEIAKFFGDSESEFGTIKFLLQNAELIGFVNYFPSGELFSRRMRVLKSLLAAADNPTEIKRRLANFRGASLKVPEKTLYLSKIYVSTSARGSGLANHLLKSFIQSGLDKGFDLTLHVEKSNSKAINLYKKYGFYQLQGIEPDDSMYHIMEKKLNGPV